MLGLLFEMGAQREQWCSDCSCLTQLPCYQISAYSAISVKKWMDGLELEVGEGGSDYGMDTVVLGVDESF